MDSRPRLNRNSAKYRELLWDACADPLTGFVHCNLCGGRVLPVEAWAESHIGVPNAHGGNVVGIGHKRCNELDNNVFVTPFVAKTKRMRRNHIGAALKGSGSKPLPGGKQSKWSKTVRGEVVPRQSQSEKHMAAMARRQIGGEA